MLRLLIRLNGTVIQEMETDRRRITIGRDAHNDLRIDNASVSGKHARILKDDEEYILEDLGSTNGTFVNKTRVIRALLREGDLIAIGRPSLENSIEISLERFGPRDRDHGLSDVEKTCRLSPEQQREILKEHLGRE